ncbi:TadE/TadG family type IV pilus assembly protein [Acidovorax cavernicola]|uniref:Pilus assembly protein n=1 Tax=Acidovorax cavernicola TaxID=1675792 RepID=A0A9X8GX58_9BURK|nr:TadE/TadG family type IV pilus assembly protein [Acidovorax cavernicola]RIX84008.1 pilus assembly protein [Acidovorax cavernicola]
MRICSNTKAQHAQSGVYAIEFAFVFLIVFALLYAVACYGFLLTMRMSLQNAAEDGARAGLRYQSNLNDRKTQAGDVAEDRTDWLPPALKANRSVAANICVAGSDDCAQANPTCGPAWNNRCQMVVTVTVSGIDTLFPALPSFAMPDRIAGKASMLLDGRSS